MFFLKSSVFVSPWDAVDAPYNTNAQVYLGWVLLLLKSMKNKPLISEAERYSP